MLLRLFIVTKRNFKITFNDILLFVLYLLNSGMHSCREENFWKS
jgi:hypothetical protein